MIPWCRKGYIIRLSRGIAPKRTAIDLGKHCILAVGPELNANATIYRNGFAVTSPHVGNVRNPATLEYLQETVRNMQRLLGAKFDVVAHDLHPQFLSTRFAREIAAEHGLELVPVQHHRAHIAAATTEPCIGIAIDGVGYGDDGTVWGGDLLRAGAGLRPGRPPRTGRDARRRPRHPVPGTDAVRHPSRRASPVAPRIPGGAGCRTRRAEKTGRLGVQCHDDLQHGQGARCGGGPARDLPRADLRWGTGDETRIGRATAGDPNHGASPSRKPEGSRCFPAAHSSKWRLRRWNSARQKTSSAVRDIAASFQFNLARGIARLAIDAAEREGMRNVALSGGVAYNYAIRETIRSEILAGGYSFVTNTDYPLGDGCVWYGQCVYAGMLLKKRD